MCPKKKRGQEEKGSLPLESLNKIREKGVGKIYRFGEVPAREGVTITSIHEN